MKREAKTVEVMIRKYCDISHTSSGELCGDCEELLQYAMARLAGCPFQENKTTCGKCPIHCYQPAMRERIQEVMRIIGPKMIFSHPLLGLGHLMDGFRKEPGPRKK